MSVVLAQYPDELVCDLAQFYGIHDHRAYGVNHIATLTQGLPEDSRVMKALTGVQYSTDSRLLALLADLMQNYMWVRFGKHGSPPTSLYKAMSNVKKEEFGFDSPEEFEKVRQAIINNAKDD